MCRKSPEIIVEPASEEDISANLRGEEPSTKIGIQNFQIQVKLLNNALWSVSSLKKLVEEKKKKSNQGPAPRKRAFQYLAENPDEHYILVTTAGVSSALNPYCILEVGQRSQVNQLNDFGISQGIASRIGIFSNESPSNVRRRIESLLQKHCRVPGDELAECILKLELAVRERLAGRKTNAFKRKELDSILSASCGEILSAIKPTYPDNIEQIRERLKKDNAVILVGPPGTGKSTMARMLVDEFRQKSPPAKLHIIKEREHLDLIHRSINAEHSHVYFVEDPWGQGKVGEKARFFTDALAPLLQQAKAGKTFVLTSRLAPYREAIEDRSDYLKWQVILDETSYSASGYREIYERQLGDWEESSRDNALELRDAMLKRLETPYAVSFFCNLLKDVASKGWVDEQVAIKLARESNVQVFGRRLRERVLDNGRSEIISAIAIWAHLTANGDFISQRDARKLRFYLKEGRLIDVPDVELFFDYLTTSRWLQKREGGFVVTPSVKEALQSLANRRANFEETLTALISSWSAQEKFRSILLCLREVKWDECLVLKSAAPPFDSFLVSQTVCADSRNFIYAFRELAEYSSTDNPAAEFARALRAKRNSSVARFKPMNYPKWTSPKLTAELIQKIEDDPNCLICAKKFIVDHLTDGINHCFFGESFPRAELLAFLNQFKWPLVDWFKIALADVLSYPQESTPYLFECMLDLAPLEIDALIDDAALSIREYQPSPDLHAEEKWRNYSEGETDASYYHLIPDNEDDSYAYIQKALSAGVARKSEKQDHTWLLGHACEAELIYAWVEHIDVETNLTAKQDFVMLCEKYGLTEAAARVVLKTPDTCFHAWAIKILLSPEFNKKDSVKLVLLDFAKSNEFLELLQLKSGRRFESAKALLGFLVLKNDLNSKYGKLNSADKSNPFSEFETLAALFSEKQKDSLEACCEKAPTTKTKVDLQYLSLLATEWPEVFAIAPLKAVAEHGGTLDLVLERFIVSQDGLVRSQAWSLCQSRRRHLEEGLVDPHYECRNTSLALLSNNPSTSEMAAILTLVNDSSAYVREHLAEQLGDKGLREGISVLITMLSDKRDYSDRPERDNRRIHTVARTACESLRKLAPFNEETVALLRDFLEACELSNRDPLVHEELFRILGDNPCSANTEFCSRYIDSIWLDSKWSNLDGFGIFQGCLHSVYEHFDHDLELTKYFDFTRTFEVAEIENDEMGLVTFSLAILALGHDAGCVDISPIIALDSFSSPRSRLLVIFSNKIRTKIPPDLRKHLSNEHSFLSFLEWTEKREKEPFSEFASEHSEFKAWLKSLENGNDGDELLCRATCNLISSAEPGD